MPDPVTALQLYARRSVDVLGPYVAPDLARRSLAARRGTQVTTDRGATWVGLFLNTQSLILSDVHVRQAIARSLDRPAIVEGLVREWGEELDAPSAGDGLRTAPTFDRYPYGAGRAAALLSGAGWKTVKGARSRRRGAMELSITVATVS
ncbi:MAG: hypothetical protein E6G68_10375, partial [Actinobacteria bacterium]